MLIAPWFVVIFCDLIPDHHTALNVPCNGTQACRIKGQSPIGPGAYRRSTGFSIQRRPAEVLGFYPGGGRDGGGFVFAGPLGGGGREPDRDRRMAARNWRLRYAPLAPVRPQANPRFPWSFWVPPGVSPAQIGPSRNPDAPTRIFLRVPSGPIRPLAGSDRPTPAFADPLHTLRHS